MTAWIGIDPGITGALALWHPDGLEVFDVPVHRIGKRSLVDHYALARQVDLWVGEWDHAGPRVVIEDVGVRPGEGAVGAFSFGRTWGLLVGVCAAHFLTIETVTPAKWKRDMGVKGDKDESRRAASAAFPDKSALFGRVKDHGRAEAALIALWASRRPA